MWQERDSIVLDRIQITGTLDVHTPLCVLLEIASAHGIRYSSRSAEETDFAWRLMREIGRTPTVTISPQDPTCHRAIARFINSGCEWTLPRLGRAFDHLLGFYSCSDIAAKIKDNFEIGQQTQEYLYSMNACILYAACRQLGVRTSINTTIEEMARMVRLSKYSSRELSLTLSSQLQNLSQATLLEIALLVGSPIPTMSYTRLEQYGEELQQSGILNRDIGLGDDPSKAIAYAAYLYNVDISSSLSPCLAYQLVKNGVGHEYPRLDRWFNHHLPSSIYNIECLHSLLIREGQPAVRDRQVAYSQLVDIQLSDTFYLCSEVLDPKFSSDVTAIYMLDLADIPKDQLIGYGIRDRPMIAFTIDELETSFRTNVSFVNPGTTTGTVFSETSLLKLEAICRSSPREEFTRLLSTIESVRRVLRSCSSQQQEFLRTYQRLPDTEQHLVVETFQSLHRLAMYMRGWDGENPVLPIVYAPVDNQDAVDIKVTEGLSDFDDRILQLSTMKDTILDLPVMRYRGGTIQVASPTTPGCTIRSRLDLVRQGPEAQTIDSCIRMTSNWLAATSHVYLNLFGCAPDYDLTTIRDIS